MKKKRTTKVPKANNIKVGKTAKYKTGKKKNAKFLGRVER